MSIGLLGVIAALGSSLGGAPPPRVAGAVSAGSCAIEGWSIDRDPRGLQVRQGPSAKSAVVGRLPPFVVSDDGDYGPAFQIIAAEAGWLHIREAKDAWRPSDLPRRPIYAGEGWVHGSMVRVSVQSASGHAAPAADSELLVDTGGDWLSERGVVTGITDCAGDWAKVRYHLPAQPARGQRSGAAWFNAICGDQRTTCDFGTRNKSR